METLAKIGGKNHSWWRRRKEEEEGEEEESHGKVAAEEA